jgi:hypothetical protein
MMSHGLHAFHAFSFVRQASHDGGVVSIPRSGEVQVYDDAPEPVHCTTETVHCHHGAVQFLPLGYDIVVEPLVPFEAEEREKVTALSSN